MKQRARFQRIGIGVVTEAPRPDMIYHYHITFNPKTSPVAEMNGNSYDFYIEEFKDEYRVWLEGAPELRECVAKFNRNKKYINQKPFTYEEIDEWLHTNACGMCFFYWRDYEEGENYHEYDD